MHRSVSTATVWLCLFFLLSIISTTPAQISWVRHDITGNLKGGHGLHAVDVNKDGKMDFLSASRDGIKSWHNNGAGQFSGSLIGNLEGAWSAFGADVDGDGDIDVAGASPHPDEQKILLWLGAAFGTPKDLPLLEAEDVCAADLDGDGIMEIIGVSWAENLPDPGNDLVYYKDYLAGPGTMVMIDPNLSGAHSVTAADFDKDGDIDLVASGDGKIYSYRNEGHGAFAAPKQLSSNGALCVNAYDIDGDGDLDFVSQERNPPNQNVYWWEGNGSLGFTKHLVGNQIGESWGVHAGDLDGDGDMDIVASSQTYLTIRAYINDGSENFTELTVVDNFGDAAGVRYAIAFDVEGDGDADVIGTTPAGDLSWFESISTPNIQVTQPNGGETWAVGATEEITWNAINGINNVNLEFSTNSGATWQPVATNVPNAGIYSWLIPNAISATCRVRVTDASNVLTKDMSDANFAIVAPEFRLTAPNGNENWYVGTTRTISWIDNQGIIPQVKIELSTDGGVIYQIITSAANNNGSYRWPIPNSPSGFCRIRISDAADGDPVDASDANFSIVSPKLTVTSPNGGENLDSGASQNITWTTTGTIDNVKLEFAADGGAFWSPIAENVSNTGSFAWTVPDTTSSTCLIKVSDAADASRVDASNGMFSITHPFISVAFPNGGESLYDTSEYNIQWTTIGTVSSVNLEYSLDNGSNWQLIATNVASTGSYLWAVPDTLADLCLIRVADAADGSPEDVSDNTFRIIRLSQNHAPVAVIGGPYSAPRDVPIAFNAGQSYDPEGDVLSFIWEFGDGQAGGGIEVVHAYAQIQNYFAKLTVSDGQGGVSVATTEVNIYNRPPNAAIAGISYVPVDSVVGFDASASSDPDGDSLTYVWSFGDSSAQYTGGPRASHAYSDPGNYQLVLHVQDNFGGGDDDTTVVIVTNNQPPIVDIRASEVSVISICDDSYTIGLTIDQAFDADGSIVSYEWDFGDGSPRSNSSVSLPHVFPVPGAYTVKLFVTDNEGAVGVDSVKITLNHDYAPLASFTVPKDTVLVNTSVNFNASATNDHEGPIVSYVWNFGDGSIETSTQPTISHVYQLIGNVEVLLTITDTCGNTSTATRTLHVVLTTGVAEGKSAPAEFELAQSFPNPVSLNSGRPSATRITFNLPRAAEVRLSIYNLFGQEVRSLARGHRAAGNHAASWDLRDDHGQPVSAGIYFYRLQAAGFVSTQKLAIVK